MLLSKKEIKLLDELRRRMGARTRRAALEAAIEYACADFVDELEARELDRNERRRAQFEALKDRRRGEPLARATRKRTLQQRIADRQVEIEEARARRRRELADQAMDEADKLRRRERPPERRPEPPRVELGRELPPLRDPPTFNGTTGERPDEE